MDKLPSPEELKMKIIVKARKSSGEDAAKNEDDDEDGLDENIQSTEDLTLKDPLQLNQVDRTSTAASSVESLLSEPNHSRALDGIAAAEITHTSGEAMKNAENVHQNDLAHKEKLNKFVEEGTRVSIRVMTMDPDTPENQVLFNNLNILKPYDQFLCGVSEKMQ